MFLYQQNKKGKESAINASQIKIWLGPNTYMLYLADTTNVSCWSNTLGAVFSDNSNSFLKWWKVPLLKKMMDAKTVIQLQLQLFFILVANLFFPAPPFALNFWEVYSLSSLSTDQQTI